MLEQVFEPGAILAIVVSNQIFRFLSPRCGLSQLLRGPFISGIGRDSGVDETSGLMMDDHKDVEWFEEQCVHDGEVTGPNTLGMVPQKGGPGLARFLLSYLAYVSLYGSFVHNDA